MSVSVSVGILFACALKCIHASTFQNPSINIERESACDRKSECEREKARERWRACERERERERARERKGESEKEKERLRTVLMERMGWATQTTTHQRGDAAS